MALAALVLVVFGAYDSYPKNTAKGGGRPLRNFPNSFLTSREIPQKGVTYKSHSPWIWRGRLGCRKKQLVFCGDEGSKIRVIHFGLPKILRLHLNHSLLIFALHDSAHSGVSF